MDHFEPKLESRNGGPVIKNSGTLTLCVEQEKLFQNFLFPKHEEDWSQLKMIVARLNSRIGFELLLIFLGSVKVKYPV